MSRVAKLRARLLVTAALVAVASGQRCVGVLRVVLERVGVISLVLM